MSFPQKMLFCSSCLVPCLMHSKPQKHWKESFQAILIFVLFAPGEDTFPGIIDIHGLGGGLLESRASLLANHGFATLALAYYQFEDLPQKPKELHLEYFEEAVNYMLQHPQVGTPLFPLGSRNRSCKALSLCPSHLWRKLQEYSPGRAGLSKDFGCLSPRK